jgi:hypothetical protein
MLRKTSLSMKKRGQGQQRPKVKKSHFFHHYFLLRKPSHSLKKSKAQKADESHQRPQIKKVKKCRFFNRHCLIYNQDPFPCPKKVVKPKSLKKIIKGQTLKNVSFYQLFCHYPCQKMIIFDYV